MPDAAVPVEVRLGLEPTPMQRGLLASQRRHPTSPLQNMALLSHLDGPVDTDRLKQAFDTVVASSDVLRSRCIDVEGTVLVRLDSASISSSVIDLSRADVHDWAVQRAAVPIDVARCGYDSVIVRHEDGTTSWYLALHHAITDATSSMLVFDLTAAAYAGREVETSAYYDWWRSNESDERARRAERHWRNRTPAPRAGQLYRPVLQPTPRSFRTPIDLEPDLRDTIEARLGDDLGSLSDDLGWTVLLMTAAAVYIHRLTGADEMALGLPVHNRTAAETRRLIGPLMEVFPVDVSIDTGDTFRALHRRIGRAVLATLRHARPGTAPPAPDCEAIVNVITRAGHGEFGDVPAVTEWIHAGASDPNHLFRLQLTNYGDGLDLLLDLNAAASDADHRLRAPLHVRDVLTAVVADPDQPLVNGSICLPGELDLLHQWGTGPDPGPAPPTLVTQLEAALRHVDAVVIEGAGVELTGRELWKRSTSLARWLRSRGVGDSDAATRVGIEMERGIDAVVAIVATLVAGGSYVPLDPAQPPERRQRLAARAGCVLVLDELPPIDTMDAIDGVASPAGDREAYLLFTSGSTGEPKGVPINHAGLARYVRFALDSYIEPGVVPVAPLFSALTFDLTVTSLFVPLLAGGRLVVIRPDGPSGLAEIARRSDLTWCKATPSHLELLLRLNPVCDLRTLVVGGEAFQSRLARRLGNAFPNVRVFNEYGPTEAVVGCMIHEVDRETQSDAADVPIGRPAPGVALRIVDRSLNEVPIGAPGELLISHAGMTSGYLADIEIDDPFVRIDDTRWYRSGDLVRLADASTLVYLGRIDEQIKTGGIRLEPTEVEHALTAHPAIERAAVRLWSPTPSAPSHHCVRCGLPSNVPGIDFDDDGVCATCHSYARIKEQAAAYFRTPADLVAVRDRARRDRTGSYDCLHLLSGGKDSTYALYQLVELGFEVRAMTLDNGYISEGAKENVRRSVTDLGIDHEFVTSDVMDEIFRDSLERHSNVCHGCYKTLYTLATTRADQLGIPVIVTGLSRGQLFETRLVPQQFGADRFDPDAIDRAVVEARRSYHRVDDGPNRLLDTSVFESDAVFERISYVDFYRYVDVELADMLAYLEDSAPWVRPADTGRSTNCLINAAGIHTHVTEQGYHNYAIPYAWDVRLGHKTRQEAIDELDDDLDMAAVIDMLGKVGYTPAPREILTAWYEVAPETAPPAPAELRAFLAGKLPAHAIPAAFVAVDQIQMTRNGKLDIEALPEPTRVHRSGPSLQVSAESELESTIVEIYERVLGLEPVGVTDDFFDLGGDSLAALGLVVELSDRLGRTVREELAFTMTTPRSLAEAIESYGDDQTTSITARPAGVAPPLGPAEQAMLFEHLDDPDDPRFNVGHLFRVHGDVDVTRFVDAVRSVVALHSPLTWTYGDPRRRLSPDEAIDVFVRSGAIEADDLPSALRRYHLQPFDLEHGPIGRCVVQPLADGSVAVLLVVHHIAVDAGSFDRLWAQIDRAYSGVEPEPSPIDYADHAAWQQERLADADLTAWLREPFADEVHFETDGGGDEPGGGYVQRTASFTTDELRSGPGTTPFATSLAALAIVLRRRSDGDRVGLGLTMSTREHPAADDLVGLFLNTVPVAVEVVPSATYEEVAREASAAVAAAMSVRAVPLARIVAARRRAGAVAPPVNILLAFEDWVPCRLGPTQVDHDVLATGSPVADLTVFVQRHGPRIELSIEHRNSVLDPDGASRLLDELDRTIRASIDRPRATAVDRSGDGSSVVVTGPMLEFDDRPLHAAIGDQAERDPAHPAVRLDDQIITYGDLDRRSSQLAHELRSRGAGPGGFVGVVAHRTPDTVVMILGVLKSGAAYVPIDPGYPPGRIRHIVADADLSMIVTSEDADPLPTTAELLTFDALELDRRPETAPDVDIAPDDLAYLIYTSGSTGLPKGVMVRHRNIVASTSARSDVYPHQIERFLLVSSFAFDSSMVGLFWTLCTGGTLVLPPVGRHDDVLVLDEVIEQLRITHLLALPSLYRLLMSEADDGQLRSLATVIVAGEACPFDVVELHRSVCASALLVNEYGPTEGTVWSHAYLIDDALDSDPVPIGTPIPGGAHLVLDETGQPVGPGEPGELLIGGAGIAAGYLGRADLTAERFAELDVVLTGGIPGPWYRTGDLVRTDDRGRLVFVGRVDEQVKIRGVRIETGEVAAVLRAHPDVTDAVVGMAAIAGRDQLVAWFVPAGAAADAASLREAMSERLPSQFIPSRFVQLSELPLGPNGKIDRRALPTPDGTAGHETAAGDGVADSAGEVTTADRAAERLAAIWADALGVASVGLDDNFFDLGGDSIVSLQIVARARRVGIELRPRQVFDHQTVRELAAVAADDQRHLPDQSPVVGDVALTPIQHWFFEQALASPDHWNQTLELDLDPAADIEVLVEALELVRDHHDQLRATFDPDREPPGQIIRAQAEAVVVRHVDLDVSSPDEVAAAVDDLEGSLDLRRGRLVGVLACHSGGVPRRLVVTIHHLVVDGVSWSPIIEDWSNAYEALVDRRDPVFPERSTSFRTWSAALASAAADDRFSGSRPFWGGDAVAGDAERALRGSPSNTEGNARAVTASLDPTQTAALVGMTTSYGDRAFTVEDVLLASLAAVVPRRLGHAHLAVLLEGHGREDLVEPGVDLSRTVGWFTTQFPVELRVSDPDDAVAVLEEVRDDLRRIPHRGIGFGVDRHLGDVDALSSIELPIVAFNYLGQLDRTVRPAFPFTAVGELRGAIASDNRRAHLLGILALIRGGRLTITVDHLPDHLDSTAAAELARDLARTIVRLTEAASAGRDPGGFDLLEQSEADAAQLSALLDQLE